MVSSLSECAEPLRTDTLAARRRELRELVRNANRLVCGGVVSCLETLSDTQREHRRFRPDSRDGIRPAHQSLRVHISQTTKPNIATKTPPSTIIPAKCAASKGDASASKPNITATIAR